MEPIIIKEVDYSYVDRNRAQIVELSTRAFLKNHEVTGQAHEKTLERHRDIFRDLLAESSADMMKQIHQHEGRFFVAETDQKKIVAISVGRPYGKSALSPKFIEDVYKSECCFKDVMKGWWKLMEKFEGTPPGKIYHQAMLAVDPAYAKQGIGAKICALTLETLGRENYDALAAETSSDFADRLAAKLKKDNVEIKDVDTWGKLTFRLHLWPTAMAEKIMEWFLDKKNPKVAVEAIDVSKISQCGVHRMIGDLMIWDSNPRDSDLPCVVMLHPNSASRMFFKNQMEDKRLTDQFRLIAIDLPGHGDSKPAEDPEATYTFPGYGKAIAQAVNDLGINRCVLLGWSLGGHVALEAMDKINGVKGVVLSGTPPYKVNMSEIMALYKDIPEDAKKLFGKPQFSAEEAATFAKAVGSESWMVNYTQKTDGRARSQLVESLHKGVGRDQTKLIETELPIAIIAGSDDPTMPKSYLESLQFGNLWRSHFDFVENCGHSLVYEKADIFNPILLQFLADAFK